MRLELVLVLVVVVDANILYWPIAAFGMVRNRHDGEQGCLPFTKIQLESTLDDCSRNSVENFEEQRNV